MLHKIQLKQEVNRMTSENLAVVVGPNLLREQSKRENSRKFPFFLLNFTLASDLVKIMGDSNRVTRVIADIIFNYECLFEVTWKWVLPKNILLTIYRKRVLVKLFDKFQFKPIKVIKVLIK